LPTSAAAEPVIVRPLTAADHAAWHAMRVALYGEAAPGAHAAELLAEIDMMLARDDWAAFAVEASDGALVGLIELFERNSAQSCTTSPVAYVEGLWVAEGWRRTGMARRLVDAGIAWARARRRSEMASDVQLSNLISQAVHEHLGFEETERLVTYRLPLDD
jgi:aminoglycoside 6'-N-acetyltransferase I